MFSSTVAKKLLSFKNKDLNISISNASITHVFIKSYYLKVLKSALETLINIFPKINTNKIHIQEI